MKRNERVDDLEEGLREAMDGQQAKLWTCLPGLVTQVDLGSQTVKVQPTIQGVLYDENAEPTNQTLPVLINVPVVWPRAGGFSLTFPIAVDDEVLVVFSSRAIDSWWQSGEVGAQVEMRMHDLTDGFAILAPTSIPKALPNVSSQNVQLRNESGTTYLEIDPTGKIKALSTSEIELQAPVINLNSDDVTITATAVATITAPSIVLDGAVEAPSGITINGEDYDLHQHGGVQIGGDVTGPVV